MDGTARVLGLLALGRSRGVHDARGARARGLARRARRRVRGDRLLVRPRRRPGAIQLRAAAQAADGAAHAELPARFVTGSAAAIVVSAPLVGTAVGAPAAALALLGPQYAAACVAAAQRGRAIGRDAHREASESMAVEAAVRIAAGAALGLALGATGIALALLLGSAAAAGWGRRAAGPLVPVSAAIVRTSALAVGLLMLLVNIDALAAPRLLGPTGADAYAVAELPARGVFLRALRRELARGPGRGARDRPTRPAHAPCRHPRVGRRRGPYADARATAPADRARRSRSSPGLLATLVAAMTVAAAVATALAMGVARRMPRPWLPTLTAAVGLAAAVLLLRPAAPGLSALVLVAAVAALAGTAAGLLGTAAGGSPPGAADELPAAR